MAVVLSPLKSIYQRTLLRPWGGAGKTTVYEAMNASAKTRTTIKGNSKNREFHLPTCEYYDCKNCTLEFKNIQVARDAGFEPCIICKDLIDE
jgi:hypothetical protein